MGAAFNRHGDRLGFGVIAAGLVVIGLGWLDATGLGGTIDGKTDLRAQLPALVATGAAGLGLMVLGSALLVVHALRRTRDRAEALMVAMADRGAEETSASWAAVSGLVVVGSAAYHAVSCRLAEVHSPTDCVTPEEAVRQGLEPCRLCRPPVPQGAAVV